MSINTCICAVLTQSRCGAFFTTESTKHFGPQFLSIHIGNLYSGFSHHRFALLVLEFYVNEIIKKILCLDFHLTNISGTLLYHKNFRNLSISAKKPVEIFIRMESMIVIV